MYMLSMKYFWNKVQIRKKAWKECVDELASKHFGMILPTNYFQMILLCGYPPPPPKNDKSPSPQK